jgi:hypothetical protein
MVKIITIYRAQKINPKTFFLSNGIKCTTIKKILIINDNFQNGIMFCLIALIETLLFSVQFISPFIYYKLKIFPIICHYFLLLYEINAKTM